MFIRRNTCFLGVLIIVIIIANLYLNKNMTQINVSKVELYQMNLHYVVFHLDLKGAPPKLEYLKRLLPVLKGHGVNALLMEYEDMFPFEGKLKVLRAPNCYSKRALHNFLYYAVKLGFEIIPLVQTFGHMEYVLKHPRFAHLRENFKYNESLCPSKVESQHLVRDMLTQVIEFHNGIEKLKHIHIGCDEVTHINQCMVCTLLQKSSAHIYIHHVMNVAEIVKSLSPNTTVLMWDDMIRQISPVNWYELINNLNMRNIDPVYWDYSSKVRGDHVSLLKYHQTMGDIWVASAFKGAEYKDSNLPNLKDRLKNHIGLLSLTRSYKFGGENTSYKFKGIILTGWSRFSHKDPLCELLPLAIPSLTLNLLLIHQFKYLQIPVKMNFSKDVFFISGKDFEYYYSSVHTVLTESLLCDTNIDIDNFDAVDCQYDESVLFNLLNDIISIVKHRKTLSRIFEKNRKLKSNDTQHFIMVEVEKTYKKQLKSLMIKFRKEMFKYYDLTVVREYIHSKFKIEKT